MAVDPFMFLVHIIVSIIVVSPSLLISGRLVVGGSKARFTDAIMIVIAGVILGSILNFFFRGLIAAVVQLIVWLGLVKHFFDATWGQAIVIAVVAVVIFIVASIVLSIILGIAIFSLLPDQSGSILI